jgi:hypothetical protein
MAPERSARMRSRLLARAAADSASIAPAEGARDVAGVIPIRPAQREPGQTNLSSPASPTTSRDASSTWPGWLLAAVLALVAAGLGIFAASNASRASALGRQVAQLENARALTADSAQQLSTELAQARSVLRDLSGPNVAMMALTAAGARAPWARMFWNQQSNRWTLIAHNLPVSPPGKAYELWLITKGQRKIPAGVFAAQANGDAVHQATYQIAADSIAMLAVTEEPATGVQSPTGPIVIATGAGTK